MSVVPPEITAMCMTVLTVTMVMYVVDWIADQRREKRLFNNANKEKPA